MMLFLMHYLPPPFNVVPAGSKYPPQCPSLKHTQYMFLPQFERLGFTITQNNRKIYSFVQLILVFTFLANRRKDESFRTNW